MDLGLDRIVATPAYTDALPFLLGRPERAPTLRKNMMSGELAHRRTPRTMFE